MAKYIVGMNLPIKSKCHESGVALIDEDGNILFAMNEERVSRIKLDGDFPEQSIKEMLKFTGIGSGDVKYVVVPTLDNAGKIKRFAGFVMKERWKHFLRLSAYKTLWKMIIREKAGAKIVDQERGEFKMRYYWRDFIKQNFPQAEIVEIDHHLAHAAGAYYTSPWENALVLTIDGAGNFLTSLIAKGEKGRLSVVAKTFLPHSVGSFWGSITKVCGFKSGTRHGGKVTGLAARGDANRLIGKMREAIRCEGTYFRVKEELFFDETKLVPSWSNYEPERMKAFLGEASREDVAAAAQMRLEEVVTELVKNARKTIPHAKIAVAGGVFANVLLNQKICGLPEIEDIYVFPAMSDGGLALGGALYALGRLKSEAGEALLPKKLASVYLGPSFTEEEAEKYLKDKGVIYKKMAGSAREVAELIDNNHVVALYQGRMEFGPRALGNRSIIYAAKDPKVNDWLNQKLKRSEFMPFAPVTLVENIKECYIGIEDRPLAANYMTITYHCTDFMKEKSPACVHIDNTARPQVIAREDNPYYYDIIKEYHKISGIPTVINTSFNMHEEPIVCSPRDAAKGFFAAEMDYLVVENLLISYKENPHVKLENL